MRIDQRNSGASVTANAGTAFSCDRWRSYLNGTGTLTFTQSSVVPNIHSSQDPEHHERTLTLLSGHD